MARALAQHPEIVVLDEPTNHLDIRYRLELLELLRSEVLTVVTALHDLYLPARFCDTVIVLQHGRITAAGAPEDVITAPLIEDAYGVTAVAEMTPHTRAVSATYLRVSDHVPDAARSQVSATARVPSTG
ncbi:ABC transporter ATP-binding protein [Microbacterium sp. JZ37]|uniref:ABC transporter ATP-binding protein n=1 Tax=Microbacterium sp. JZ37 TaxID=2654193 RepID=UPI002B47EAEE|nr:ABC transporter ATP-binding protein [Microbacterium sp. JZ37]WRH17930.1 hypothetical protein GC092_10670 [Microbacterium sp. JZ37]